jgi:hypothetical protein
LKTAMPKATVAGWPEPFHADRRAGAIVGV